MGCASARLVGPDAGIVSPRPWYVVRLCHVINNQTDRTYESNHVDHRRIASNKQEKRNLYCVCLFDVAGLNLLRDQFADQIILRLLRSLVNKIGDVVQQSPSNSQLSQSAQQERRV